VALEQQQTGMASAVVVNNLGNVEGALGRWDDAMRHYQEAAEDPEMGSIAGANYALAAFETGRNDLAVKAARTLLRRWALLKLLSAVVSVWLVHLCTPISAQLSNCA
jgi:Tfp pilus assembly protein PilF